MSSDRNTWNAVVLEEITTYASEALSRFGAPGQLHVEQGEILLVGPHGTTRAELGALPHGWSNLPEDVRRRRVTELVRRLVAQRTPSRERTNEGGLPPWVWLLVAGSAAAVGAALFAARGTESEDTEVVRRKANASRPAAVEDSERERSARAARVCETTRERVLRGATLGPTDVEGWVVDIVVLKKGGAEPLDTAPVLRSFVADPASKQGTRFVWAEEPELLDLPGSDSRVLVGSELIEGQSAERTPGVRLTFQGRLIDHYFDPDKRRSFFHIASSLTDVLGGTHAGLFARCDGSATHHVGSWFRGSTPGDAAASLVYLMGTYSFPTHVAEPFLHPPSSSDIDRSHAFSNVVDAGSKLDQRAIAGVVGKSGGMISGPAGGPYVITFPFGDGNRSARASRDLARATKISRE